ncbi:hypothetical protein SISNIDRAFT_526835 [Sistotremastrum niveocremeum HHB9708]|uniref:Uncharacterized protein n=1 Tax=Sistotremastrum niveocremeum HHB9708 TaxID=1314777 RepID=A0A164QB97_9AGAM|nr:hypothetical protein SISNIDRAFT_526835 [Sistotremastrum niveocremeum HHB9708]
MEASLEASMKAVEALYLSESGCDDCVHERSYELGGFLFSAEAMVEYFKREILCDPLAKMSRNQMSDVAGVVTRTLKKKSGLSFLNSHFIRQEGQYLISFFRRNPWLPDGETWTPAELRSKESFNAAVKQLELELKNIRDAPYEEQWYIINPAKQTADAIAEAKVWAECRKNEGIIPPIVFEIMFEALDTSLRRADGEVDEETIGDGEAD